MTEPAEPLMKTASMNAEFYSRVSGAEELEDVAPHLRHSELKQSLFEMARRVFEQVSQTSDRPEVLDMGAGTGVLSLPLLEMGALVTAVDAAQPLLDVLVRRAAVFGTSLRPVAGDIFETAELCLETGKKFDLICACSFLHHIPDYLKLCRMVARLIKPNGAFFSFADPLRYDTLPPMTYLLDRSFYFAWRLFQGNYVHGFKTFVRRLRRIYREDEPADMIEYHVVRNGVDQEAIRLLFETEGFTCDIQKYWSTPSALPEYFGIKLGLTNSFAVVATKQDLRT